MAHWCERFIGRPYVEKEFDCGVLAETVQREIFGRDLHLPSERDYVGEVTTRNRFAATAAQIRGEIAAFAERTEIPQEGDGVLLRARGYDQHIGIYCIVDGEPAVLHAADCSRQVVLCKVRELGIRGLRVSGYYRWI